MFASSIPKKEKEIYPFIEEIQINPEIFKRPSPSIQKSEKKNIRPIKNFKRFHVKIKSAQNPGSKYKGYQNSYNSQTHQSQTLSTTTKSTPEIEKIETRYKNTITKVDNNISNLNKKFKNLISEVFNKSRELDKMKMRFIKLKKD